MITLRYEGHAIAVVTLNYAPRALTGLALATDAPGRLSREAIEALRATANEQLRDEGTFAAISYLQEELGNRLPSLESGVSAGATATAATTADPQAAVASRAASSRQVLLHIDHMRREREYIEMIANWVEELGLCGKLIFCGPKGAPKPLILLHLRQQGRAGGGGGGGGRAHTAASSADAISEYLRRHRTSTVDVDSKGRPCKEKMMSVLFDSAINTATATEGTASGRGGSSGGGPAEAAHGFMLVRLESHAEARRMLLDDLHVPAVVVNDLFRSGQ